MEFTAGVYTGAAINMAGAIGPINGGVIGPGEITIIAAPLGFGEAIYLGNTQSVEIDGITFSSSVGGIGINMSPGSSMTAIGRSNSFGGFTTNEVNNGVNNGGL
jgi:hypothetical protein